MLCVGGCGEAETVRGNENAVDPHFDFHALSDSGNEVGRWREGRKRRRKRGALEKMRGRVKSLCVVETIQKIV